MIKVVSFSPFHGKINVDYMLKKKKTKKENQIDVLIIIIETGDNLHRLQE